MVPPVILYTRKQSNIYFAESRGPCDVIRNVDPIINQNKYFYLFYRLRPPIGVAVE